MGARERGVSAAEKFGRVTETRFGGGGIGGGGGGGGGGACGGGGDAQLVQPVMATWFSIFSSAVEGRVLDEGAGAMRPKLRGMYVGPKNQDAAAFARTGA